WIKYIPGKENPESFMSIFKKVEVIASMGLGTINVYHINRNRFIQLDRLGENYDAYDFSRFELEKRYSLLISFLFNNNKNHIYQLIENNYIILSINKS
ncbi:hypothetical protein ACO1NA_13940, partial [Staphylococcus aureus]